MPEADGRLIRQVMEDREVTQAHQREILLGVLQEKMKDQEQTEATQQLVDMAVRAGRIQSAKVIGKMADVIHISQLRELKALAKHSAIAWTKACEMFGFSSKTADQYLRLGDSLGDDFVADMSAIGVSVRALEEARRLPEDIRQRLTSGEVIDLDEVSKEALTSVIKDLSREHNQELAAKDADLSKERKAREKAENKSQTAQDRLEAARQELEVLKAGLPSDDKEAIKIIRDIEKNVLPKLKVFQFTKMQGRSPEAIARIITSLEIVRELAGWTSNHLAALAEGEEPDDEALGAGTRTLATEIKSYDGQPAAGF